METFWLIFASVGGIVIFAFSLWLVWFLPWKIIKKMAKKRNLEEPRGWMFAVYFLSWWAVLFYAFKMDKIDAEKEKEIEEIIKPIPKEEAPKDKKINWWAIIVLLIIFGVAILVVLTALNVIE